MADEKKNKTIVDNDALKAAVDAMKGTKAEAPKTEAPVKK